METMSLFDIILNGLVMFGVLFAAGLALSYPLKRFFDSKYCADPQKMYKRIAWILVAVNGIAFVVEILTRRFGPPRDFDTISNFVTTQRWNTRLPFDGIADRIVGRMTLMIEVYTERLYLVFVVLAALVLLHTIVTMIKIKHEEYDMSVKAFRSLLGSLIIIPCILFFNASTIGWLTPSYIAESPRYTSCGTLYYHMQFTRLHRGQYEPVLVAQDVETGYVIRVYFAWRTRVSSHDGSDGTWATLTPTENPNIYILTRTSLVNGTYPEHQIRFFGYPPWRSGSGWQLLTTLAEPAATGPFMYTHNGRFRYRLEDTYLSIGFDADSRGPIIQLSVYDTKTGAQHTFRLLNILDDDIRHDTLHEPIQLEPTDTAHLYILHFANGVDSFSIDFAEGTAERTNHSFSILWRISNDGLIEYSITISGRQNLTDFEGVSPSSWYDVTLHIRHVDTSIALIVNERISEVALRRYMSNSQAFDWLTIKPRQIREWEYSWTRPVWWYMEGLHEVVLEIPCGYPAQPGHRVNLIVDIENRQLLWRTLSGYWEGWGRCICTQ